MKSFETFGEELDLSRLTAAFRPLESYEQTVRHYFGAGTCAGKGGASPGICVTGVDNEAGTGVRLAALVPGGNEFER